MRSPMRVLATRQKMSLPMVIATQQHKLTDHQDVELDSGVMSGTKILNSKRIKNPLSTTLGSYLTEMFK
jgi:hypothetical protein